MCAAYKIHTSIIIPTRNHASMLKRVVEGLKETAQAFANPIELIIVDNNSSEDDALQYLSHLDDIDSTPFANIQVLRFPNKFNYSAMNNVGASNSRAQFLCLLNNDIEIIEPHWLNAMTKPLTDVNTGCVGAMLYYPDNTIQHAGVFLDEKNVAGHLYKNLPRGSSGNNQFLLSDQYVSAVTAACLLVRRDIYNNINGFNEQLAVAFNDVDFCLKIKRAGYNIVWTPHAELHHHESKSRGQKHQRSWLQKRRHKEEVKLMKTLWNDQLKNEPHHPIHTNPSPTSEQADENIVHVSNPD